MDDPDALEEPDFDEPDFDEPDLFEDLDLDDEVSLEGDWRSILSDHSIVVGCGSGGVGKTTISAALALQGARIGLRSCVVTIDPARRLADSLGLANLGNTPHQVDGQ